MKNDNPTGSVMLTRSLKVKEMVLDALKEYPQGRGDDMLLYLHILRKHYWRLVKIQTKPRLILNFGTFENFLYTPSYETVRRRRQEWQARFEDLRPTERVQHKRMRLQEAMFADFTHNNTTLGMFE